MATYTSNVPIPKFLTTGLSLPAESDILTGRLDDYTQAFGADLNRLLNTPQGQICTTDAAVIGDYNDLLLYYVNQIDPDRSEGVMQDAIAKIYYLTRKPATATAVDCNCIGLEGTVIPAGTLAKDTGGNIYKATNQGIIDSTGTITLQFQAVDNGVQNVAAMTVTEIYQSIIGWDRIENPTAGIAGSAVENRSDFEYRRYNSVQRYAHGSLGSIYANVAQLSGVIDCYVTENVTNATVNTGSTSYPLVAHSVYVAVVGGSAQDIGNTIWGNKNEGSNYNGNTNVTVLDNSPGYVAPYPSYAVKFQRPTSLAIKFAIVIASNPALPSTIASDIKTAIINAFSGRGTLARERIGKTVYASPYYCIISAVNSTMALVSVLVGTTTATLTSQAIGIDQYPVLTDADITVTMV